MKVQDQQSDHLYFFATHQKACFALIAYLFVLRSVESSNELVHQMFSNLHQFSKEVEAHYYLMYFSNYYFLMINLLFIQEL